MLADFLRVDVRVKQRRHLILATKPQLEQLAKAKIWYMDATFKLVRKAFTQLLIKHQHVCEVGAVRHTGSLSVCFDVGEKKKSDLAIPVRRSKQPLYRWVVGRETEVLIPGMQYSVRS